jgi:FkbM family methyltransferase
MKLLNTSFDKNECKLYFEYTSDIDLPDSSIVVSDLHLDCPYFEWENILFSRGFNCWIAPFNSKLQNIISQNNKFPGFCVKVYGPNKRLLQVDKFVMNDVDPLIKRPYNTPTHDAVGPSYVDFFFGDLCEGIDTTGVVIDAGANVGFFTLFAKENGATRVYSIEPDPLPYNFLESNYKHDHSVITINKVLSHKNEPVDFNIVLVNSVGSVMSEHRMKDDNVFSTKIDSISLHNILNLEPTINLLKLDIEGAEYDVLDNLDSSYFKNINQLFIEFHKDPKPIFNRLVNEGYQVEYRHSNENDIAGFIYAKRI